MSSIFSNPSKPPGRLISKWAASVTVDSNEAPITDVASGFAATKLTTAEALKMFSSSAADAAAGTGARTARIEYLDANYAELYADVTFNGASDIGTVPTVLAVNDCYVLTTGSGNVNAGNISIRNAANSKSLGFMPATHGRTQHSHYTVPAGKNLVIYQWGGGLQSTALGITVEFRLKTIGVDVDVQVGIDVFKTGNLAAAAGATSTSTFIKPCYHIIPEKTFVAVYGKGNSGADQSAFGGFDGYLVNRS